MIQEQETEQAGQDVISASCNNCSNSDCNNCNELRVRENCPKHRSNTISNFCKTCDIAICGDCLVKDHLSHVLETLKDAYKRKVDELDIQKLTLDELHEKNRKRMDEVKEKTSYNVKEIKTIQSNLNSRYTTMIDKIDTMHDKNNKILKQYQTDHESWGQKEQDRLMANESTITRKIEQCSAARTYKLSFLIKRVEENRNLEDLNLPPLIEPDLPIASSTQFRDDEIQNQLGTVFKENDNKTSNVITFQLPFPAKGIMAQGREKVWIGSTREPDLQQYFITGDPIITAKTNCKVSNFAFKNSTEILLCDQYNRSVMCKSLENGKIETIVHFDDSSVPRGLCINGNNEIVLTRCFALSGMIQIYSMDGIMTKTILRDSRTNDYIFSEPIEIICNAAIGCCVLDAGKQEIIAVSEQGNIRWRYKGRWNDTAKFKPKALCCDDRNNILVSNNKTVELIDKDGKFIGSILTKNDVIENIWGLSYDESHNLWVGGQKLEKNFFGKHTYDIIQRYTSKEYRIRMEKHISANSE